MQPIANAGINQSICTTQTNLDGNEPDAINGESGLWTVEAGTGVFLDATDAKTQVSGLTAGVNHVFRWTVTRSGCPDASATVAVEVGLPASVADAGTDQSICDDRVTLNANIPIVGTGQWALVAGSGTITNPAQASTTVTALGPGINTFRWTITGTCDFSIDQVNIERIEAPTVSQAGTDQTVCAETTTLAANTPLIGTGQWTVLAGSAIVENPTDPNSGVNTLSVGDNILRWTISNGTCPTSTSTVRIRRDVAPTATVASTLLRTCETSIQLDADTPSAGSGVWTVLSGGGSLVNPNDPDALVTNLGIGSNLIQWTVSNGSCPSAQATVLVLRVEEPSLALAGTDRDVCDSVVFLAATPPTIGTGQWTLVNGSGIIEDSLDPNTRVRELGLGVNRFRWTVSNESCTPQIDEVNITRREFVSTALAGTDFNTCDDEVSLNGNTPTEGSGTWTLVAGQGNILDPSNPQTRVSNLGNGTNVFRWTISNGVCPSSSATVSVTRQESPTASAAGTDQVICASSTTLSANTPSVGSGTWTVIQGSGLFQDASNANTLVSNLAQGVNTFQWTINNGVCPPSTSLVRITREAEPSVADAGEDQTICAEQLNLEGNFPSTGVGTWTIISGTGIIDDPNNPQVLARNLSPGVNTFQWEINNGVCPASTDIVNITREALPSVSIAGADQTICGTGATFDATPPVVGTGIWTVIQGNGVVTNPNSPTSTVTGLSLGLNTFQWTVSNGTCPSSSAFVNITREQTASISFAGVDQNVCNSSATLNANIPQVGQGEWTVIAGSAVVTDPGNPQSGVSNLSFGANTFRWTVSNACGATSSNVSIIRDTPPTISNAGDDFSVCAANTDLRANTPSSGVGEWTIVSGTGILDDAANPNSGVSGLSIGENVFRWTIRNGTCTESSSTVILTRDDDPSTANAGDNISICGDSQVLLNAIVPNVGTGSWTQISGPNSAFISNPDVPQTEVGNLVSGTYTFRWTVSNGACPSNSDEVEVNVTGNPLNSPNIAVSDPEICSEDLPTTMSITVSNTESGVTYELRNAIGQSLATVLSNGGGISFDNLVVPETSEVYEVFAKKRDINAQFCPEIKLSDAANVQVESCNPIPTRNILLRTDFCTDLIVNLRDSIPNGENYDFVPIGNRVTNNGGIINLNPNGMLVYEPREGFLGSEEFIYQLCDQLIPATCDTSRIRITIEACSNDAPEAFSDDYTGRNCQEITGNLLDNDRDPENRTLVVADTSTRTTANRGVFSVLANGDFRYTPPEGFVGTDSIAYTIRDDGAGSIDKTSQATAFFSLIDCEDIFIPEGFSPNGDGINDVFIIQGIDLYKTRLRVYNRWGNIVYESEDYQNDWDGTANRGNRQGVALPDGTYYYVASFEGGPGNQARYITILR